MGSGLYESQPVFRQAIDACDEILSELWDGESLVDVLYPKSTAADDPKALIHQTEFTQPALFALEYALAELWRSWGVEPAAVIGHSQGEIAAAYVCGALSLRDATRIVALRSQALVSLIGHGAMGSVVAPADLVEERLAPWQGRVSVAVVNGPRSVVLSGEPDALDEFIEAMKADGIQAQGFLSSTHHILTRWPACVTRWPTHWLTWRRSR